MRSQPTTHERDFDDSGGNTLEDSFRQVRTRFYTNNIKYILASDTERRCSSRRQYITDVEEGQREPRRKQENRIIQQKTIG